MQERERREESATRRVALRLSLSLGLAAVIAALFLEIAAVAIAGPVPPLDEWVFEAATRMRSPVATGLMVALSVLGSKPVLGLLSLPVLVLLYRRGEWLRIVLLVATFYGGSAIAMELKDHFERPRPPYDASLWSPSGHGFPSGHATDAMLFFGVLVLLLGASDVGSARSRSLTMALLLLLAVMIGLSRLYLGVHYLSDVVAGYLFALFWIALCAGIADAISHAKTFRSLHPTETTGPPAK